ncbi:hypothetical protein J6V86_03785 [bacterium]|nr:hypothetical protein [bacterium]
MDLSPKSANYKEDPIPEDEMNELIKTTDSKIHAVNEEIQVKKELAEKKEQEKYEETAIGDSLKVINTEIDRIEQVIKA